MKLYNQAFAGLFAVATTFGPSLEKPETPFGPTIRVANLREPIVREIIATSDSGKEQLTCINLGDTSLGASDGKDGLLKVAAIPINNGKPDLAFRFVLRADGVDLTQPRVYAGMEQAGKRGQKDKIAIGEIGKGRVAGSMVTNIHTAIRQITKWCQALVVSPKGIPGFRRTLFRSVGYEEIKVTRIIIDEITRDGLAAIAPFIPPEPAKPGILPNNYNKYQNSRLTM